MSLNIMEHIRQLADSKEFTSIGSELANIIILGRNRFLSPTMPLHACSAVGMSWCGVKLGAPS